MDKKIVIINDLLSGTMGEKVFWDFMLEGFPDMHGVDKKITKNFKKYINECLPETEVIIQNATFIDLVDSERFTISYLQDNLRAMGRQNVAQDYILYNSNIIVSNSKITAASYPEYDIKIIPIGVDSELFKPNGKSVHNKKTGIFIGNLNAVKGWPKIQAIIQKRQDIDWIIVSKGKEKFMGPNISMYNRVQQKLLSFLINKSDFFIVGSPVETECLAAIESCMCNVPIVMHNTGIFADFSDQDKKAVGYIGDNLEDGIEEVLSKEYNPRNIMFKYGLDVNSMISKWKELLKSI